MFTIGAHTLSFFLTHFPSLSLSCSLSLFHPYSSLYPLSLPLTLSHTLPTPYHTQIPTSKHTHTYTCTISILETGYSSIVASDLVANDTTERFGGEWGVGGGYKLGLCQPVHTHIHQTANMTPQMVHLCLKRTWIWRFNCRAVITFRSH